MNQNILRPNWRRPPPPKSLWQKILAGLFGGLSGFFSILPIPKGIPFLRPLSYFVRPLEQKPGEKAEAAASEQKVKELIKSDVNRQVAMWSEAADPDKNTVAYKVQNGDSLWKIAQSQYGDGMRWIDIWTANRVSIKEPNLIFAGQELKVPKQIIRRTALFQVQAPAPQKSAVKTAGGELVKKQIVTAARSIEQAGLKTTALINQKLTSAEITGEQKTIALQIANQINGNIVDARSYARQAESITDLNANSVDLSVRTLDLGRETIQLAQAAEVIPAPAPVQTTPTMAWSQDAAGNIRYYTMQNGAWAPSEVNPIGNIGAVYGTQDITQTPEYKSGKIIKILPQPAPSPVEGPAPAPYGGAVLNTEQQKIYERLQSTGGVAAEQYKKTILSSSPLAVVAPSSPVASAAAAAASAAGISQSSSVLSQAVGNAVAVGVNLNNISITNADKVSATMTVIRNVAAASAISAPAASADAAGAIAAAAGVQSVALSSAGNIVSAYNAAAMATAAAIVANVAAPDSPQALAATQAAASAIVMLQSVSVEAAAAPAAPTAPTASATSINTSPSAPTASVASVNTTTSTTESGTVTVTSTVTDAQGNTTATATSEASVDNAGNVNITTTTVDSITGQVTTNILSEATAPTNATDINVTAGLANTTNAVAAAVDNAIANSTVNTTATNVAEASAVVAAVAAAIAPAPTVSAPAAPSASADSSSVSSTDASATAASPTQGAAISSLGGGRGSVGGAFASAATFGLTNALGLTSDFGDQSVTLGQNVVSGLVGLGALATGVPAPLGMVARGVAGAINQSQANDALAAQQADMGLQAAYGSYRSGERSGVAPGTVTAPTAMDTAAVDTALADAAVNAANPAPETPEQSSQTVTSQPEVMSLSSVESQSQGVVATAPAPAATQGISSATSGNLASALANGFASSGLALSNPSFTTNSDGTVTFSGVTPQGLTVQGTVTVDVNGVNVTVTNSNGDTVDSAITPEGIGVVTTGNPQGNDSSTVGMDIANQSMTLSAQGQSETFSSDQVSEIANALNVAPLPDINQNAPPSQPQSPLTSEPTTPTATPTAPDTASLDQAIADLDPSSPVAAPAPTAMDTAAVDTALADAAADAAAAAPDAAAVGPTGAAVTGNMGLGEGLGGTIGLGESTPSPTVSLSSGGPTGGKGASATGGINVAISGPDVDSDSGASASGVSGSGSGTGVGQGGPGSSPGLGGEAATGGTGVGVSGPPGPGGIGTGPAPGQGEGGSVGTPGAPGDAGDGGAAGAPFCIVMGTPVLLIDGSTRAIESIKPGEQVLGCIENQNIDSATVSELLQHNLSDHPTLFVVSAADRTLTITGDHRLKTPSGWKRADTIKNSDTVFVATALGQQPQLVAVEQVSQINSESFLYTIRTSTNNYFANGILINTE